MSVRKRSSANGAMSCGVRRALLSHSTRWPPAECPINTTFPLCREIFAGSFALYSGLVFLAVTALGLTPVFHWVLHRFHWEWASDEEAK